MARKFASKSYLSARLGSTRLFWRVRHSLGWLNFRRLRTGFQLKSSVKNFTSEAQYWRVMSKGTTAPIILAIVIGVALYIFERNISFFTHIVWLEESIFGQYLRHPLNNDTYVQMLTVIAGVTGVFLGLYFNAVSTVVSSGTYSSAPGDIRELILKDRLKNNYVRLVTFLTALSVILLAFSATNIAPLHLAIPILAIVSCLAIFIFIRLGFKTLFLSDDPTILFGTLSGEILKWAKQATYRGYQWQNPSFQEHYRKQALKSVTTLVTLAELSSRKAELQSKTHPRLLNNLLALTSVYFDDKHLIPSDSNWYGKKPRHKQWYLSDSADIEMATQTDTTLQPTQVPYTTWLEDVLLDVVFEAYKSDANVGDYQALYNKIASLPDFFSGMGGNWLAEDGEKWHTRLSNDILANLTNGQDIDEIQEPNSVAVTDILASIPMSIELGFIRAINELNVSNLRRQLLNTNLLTGDAPYRLSLPLSTVKTLEEVHMGALFEKRAQSYNKTPNWYVTEVALHDLELAIYGQWQSLIKLLETWYIETGLALNDAKRYRQSATVYSRAIELAWKLDSHIERLRELSQALRKDGKIEFLKKAEWDWDKEHDKVIKFRNLAVKRQAELIPRLWNTKEPDPDMPDFFGGAVHRTGEACYEALKIGDVDTFNTLFRSYFLGILGVFESLKLEVQGWDELSSAITWMSEPILDLFDISGYAYVYAEYHNKPELWTGCKNTWDTYLTNMPQQLQSFAVISNYHQTPRGVITPRDTLRSRWHISMAQLLNDLPRQDTNDFYSQPSVQHESELIRNIAPWDNTMPFTHADAIDVFTIKYLINVNTNDVLDFGIDQDKVNTVNGRQGDENA